VVQSKSDNCLEEAQETRTLPKIPVAGITSALFRSKLAPMKRKFAHHSARAADSLESARSNLPIPILPTPVPPRNPAAWEMTPIGRSPCQRRFPFFRFLFSVFCFPLSALPPLPPLRFTQIHPQAKIKPVQTRSEPIGVNQTVSAPKNKKICVPAQMVVAAAEINFRLASPHHLSSLLAQRRV
jgi:hypothetical protein